MAGGTKKYQNPGNLLNCFVDGFGNQIRIGDQQDVGEFNMTLLERIDEGLKG